MHPVILILLIRKNISFQVYDSKSSSSEISKKSEMNTRMTEGNAKNVLYIYIF